MLHFVCFFALLGGSSVSGMTTVAPNSPPFTNLPFSMNFAEGQSVGTFIYQVAATVPAGESGVVFTINNVYPDSHISAFTITSAGRLSTAALLDADVASPVTYVVEVRVCDTSGTCNHDNLTLTITEGNDPPVFTPSVVSLTLTEDTPVGTVLQTSWTLADEDGDFQFTYSLDPAGVGPAYFSVHPSTGNINLTNSLDYENTTDFPDHSVLIVVKATDPHGLVGSLNLTVLITDVNDCPATFQDGDCVGYLTENDPIGTYVLTVNASDCDVTAGFRNFSYILNSPYDQQYQLVDQEDGSATLITKAVINREDIPNLQGLAGVEVTSRDQGGLTSSVFCLVTVGDVNEYDPVFSQSVYRYFVPQDADIGTSIDRLVPTDLDSTGRPFIYEAFDLDSNLYVGIFDGMVMVTGALHQGQILSFKVNASDQGVPPRSSNTVDVIVQTFDPKPYLTDWAVDTGGAYFGRAEEAALQANIASSCYPCTPKVSSIFHSTVNSNHYVARVYIVRGRTNTSSALQMWTTQEILDRYTIGDGKTPTQTASGLGPGYPVVRIQETYSINWWLETPAGIATTSILSLLAAGLLIAAGAVIAYKYWWLYRPENRKFLELVDESKKGTTAT